METFFLLVAAFAVFVVWLCTKILDKAGLNKAWAICLFVPILNIIMLWIFAFTQWPGLKHEQK